MGLQWKPISFCHFPYSFFNEGSKIYFPTTAFQLARFYCIIKLNLVAFAKIFSIVSYCHLMKRMKLMSEMKLVTRVALCELSLADNGSQLTALLRNTSSFLSIQSDFQLWKNNCFYFHNLNSNVPIVSFEDDQFKSVKNKNCLNFK